MRSLNLWAVTQDVPIIFTPPVARPTVTPGGRAFALFITGISLSVLLIALSLSPSPAGLGTHQALGYQRCQFLLTTGLPCPTCGMTTSFAHFVRGQWLASFYVQPMGFLLALITGAFFWASLYVAVTGKPIHRLLRQVPMPVLILTMMSLAIAAWGWKIFIHLRGIDGWS
jgi:hypothetical protein